MRRLTQSDPACKPAGCSASRADTAAAKPVLAKSVEHPCCPPCRARSPRALHETPRPPCGSRGMLPGQPGWPVPGSGQDSGRTASAARRFWASITTTACKALSRQPRRLGKDTKEPGVARGGRSRSRAGAGYGTPVIPAAGLAKLPGIFLHLFLSFPRCSSP